MSRVIRVASGIAPVAYSSLSDASSAAEEKILDSKKKCSLVNGRFVTGYSYSKDALVIDFDNDWHLLVSVGDNEIRWDVVLEKPSLHGGELGESISFQLSNGETMRWEQSTILDGFVGKQAAISPSDQYLFIFARNEAEHMFSVFVNQENLSEKFLVISVT
jgi:hypothetical protein